MRFLEKGQKKNVKKGKIIENLSKNVQNSKYVVKSKPHARDYCMHETARIHPVVT